MEKRIEYIGIEKIEWKLNDAEIRGIVRKYIADTEKLTRDQMYNLLIEFYQDDESDKITSDIVLEFKVKPKDIPNEVKE